MRPRFVVLSLALGFNLAIQVVQISGDDLVIQKGRLVSLQVRHLFFR